MISKRYNEQMGNYLAKLANSKMKDLAPINKSVTVTVHPHDIRLIPHTNADKIRHMTDEELADRIMGYIRCEACEREFHIECNPLMTCRGIWLEWLKQEVVNG